MKNPMFSYQLLDTPIHRLSGLTKLIAFLLLSFAVMFSYDIRAVVAVLILSLYTLKLAKIQWRQIRLMVIYVVVFVLTNAVITFIFSPEQGVKIYGSRHVVVHIIGIYTLTLEQLFYQITKLIKYAAVVPFGITFLLTTDPSEFASSLSRIGVPYKASTAVSLTLRYFPDVIRDYQTISWAQQARGLEMSSKAGLVSRFKNALMILVPLIFSTLDRVEVISNAMDLRGYGKHRKRTWYTSRKLMLGDWITLSLSAGVLLATLGLTFFVNHSRFFNPF